MLFRSAGRDDAVFDGVLDDIDQRLGHGAEAIKCSSQIRRHNPCPFLFRVTDDKTTRSHTGIAHENLGRRDGPTIDCHHTLNLMFVAYIGLVKIAGSPSFDDRSSCGFGRPLVFMIMHADIPARRSKRQADGTTDSPRRAGYEDTRCTVLRRRPTCWTMTRRSL